MRAMLKPGKLSIGQKLSRLGVRMKDPEWRRYAMLVAAGKTLGLALLLSVIVAIAIIPELMSGTAHAQATTAPATQAAVMPVMPADLSDIVKNPTDCQSDQHRLDVGCCIPCVLHAGRFHDA
jgi:hypothetical protein